jgi:hypothetical protein
MYIMLRIKVSYFSQLIENLKKDTIDASKNIKKLVLITIL